MSSRQDRAPWTGVKDLSDIFVERMLALLCAIFLLFPASGLKKESFVTDDTVVEGEEADERFKKFCFSMVTSR